MAVIADDTHAINPSNVAALVKRDADEVWWIEVYGTGGGPSCPLRFESADSRDGFYKELVEAMKAS